MKSTQLGYLRAVSFLALFCALGARAESDLDLDSLKRDEDGKNREVAGSYSSKASIDSLKTDLQKKCVNDQVKMADAVFFSTDQAALLKSMRVSQISINFIDNFTKKNDIQADSAKKPAYEMSLLEDGNFEIDFSLDANGRCHAVSSDEIRKKLQDQLKLRAAQAADDLARTLSSAHVDPRGGESDEQQIKASAASGVGAPNQGSGGGPGFQLMTLQ